MNRTTIKNCKLPNGNIAFAMGCRNVTRKPAENRAVAALRSAFRQDDNVEEGEARIAHWQTKGWTRAEIQAMHLWYRHLPGRAVRKKSKGA